MGDYGLEDILRNQPQRCECHACTQARLPQIERTMFSLSPAQTIRENIAEAVLAERERCAKIAEDGTAGVTKSGSFVRSFGDWLDGFREGQLSIAAKIREGK